MNDREHFYQTTICWTGNKGNGTKDYRAYERSHVISIAGKTDIHASSDPAFRGDKTKHNPEELLLAALSSCHMLWYLHLCADSGIIVLDYVDHARGVMIENNNGGGRFTEVLLSPLITVKNAQMIEKAIELHEPAHDNCFIANSVNFPVVIKASIQTQG